MRAKRDVWKVKKSIEGARAELQHNLRCCMVVLRSYARARTPLMIWRIYYLCEHMRTFTLLVRTHVCAFGVRASSVDATTFNIIITIIMLIIIMIIVLVCRFVVFILFSFLFVFRCWIWKSETRLKCADEKRAHRHFLSNMVQATALKYFAQHASFTILISQVC